MGVGGRIKALRKALNLTQEEFASNLRISKGFLSNLENEIRQPSKQLLRLIAHQYSSSENWLSNGEGEMFVFPWEIIQVALLVLGEESFKKEIIVALRKLNIDINMDEPHFVTNETDSDLNNMLNFITELWSLKDEKLRNWAQVQLERAFPQDMVEKVHKRASLNITRRVNGSPE